MTREEFLNVALLQATVEGVGIHLAKFANICIEWATNEAIEKACEWLDENMNDVGIRFMRGDEIKDIVDLFRKAMKGE